MRAFIFLFSSFFALLTPGTLLAQDLSEIFASSNALETYQGRYAEANNNKAFAQSLGGAWAWTSNRTKPEDAITYVLSRCEYLRRGQGSPCALVDLNGRLVAPQSPEGYYIHHNQILEVYQNRYANATYHKAFAISENSFGMRDGLATEQEAIDAALAACNQHVRPGQSCKIFDVNGRLQDW